jgi:allophanate hydrolase subunit 1
MAASGARAQKPVGSAAWISTEKENITNLVNQEMEEVEYPVRYEMDWLNEHMAEIFSNNQLSVATDISPTSAPVLTPA